MSKPIITIRALNAAGAGLALLAAVPTAARLLEPWRDTPMPQLAAFTPWALPTWVVAGALLLVGRRRHTMAAIVVATALVVALGVRWQVPSKAARDAGLPATAAGLPLRVMTLNVLFGQADAAETLALVRRHKVDVLVMQELTPEFHERLQTAGIDEELGYAALHPRPRAAGTGIWSRWNLRPGEELSSTGFEMPSATIILPGSAGTVSVTGIHAQPPRTEPFAIARWRRDLASIAGTEARKVATGDAGARIYAGDFNASRDHTGFRAILDTGLIDAGDAGSAVPWPGFTWPADMPGPAATRIDHVLLTPATLGVRKVSVVTVSGTDHHGVVADLVVLPR